MSNFPNGTMVVWTSNKPRTRKAVVVTTMKCANRQPWGHHCIVKVTDGLPGENGEHFVIPPGRLTIDHD